METLKSSINTTVSKSDLRDRLDEVLAQVQIGAKVLITDNGHSLAEMIPVAPSNRANGKRTLKLLATKEEFLAEIASLDATYMTGNLSSEDCHLARAEPVDMGPTSSSNLDLVIYK